MNCISIKSGAALTRTIARAGKPDFTVRYQRAAIDAGDDYPRPFELELGRDRAPYPPGNYAIDAASFTTNEYDGLKLKRDVVLVAIPATPAPKA